MRILSILFLSLVTYLGHTQNLVGVEVAEVINLKIPDTFINMSDQDRMAKVASSKVPLAMFSTQSQDVTLGINDNFMQWTDGDTETVYGFYKASLKSLFDDIEFYQDEVRKINGREFIIFEFTSTVREENAFKGERQQKNYTYIQYTSYNDQVLLFNFGCRERIRNQWQETARSIMESIKID